MTPPERGGSTIRAVDEVSIRKSRPGKMLLRFSDNHLIALASSATILRGFMHSFDARNPWKLHDGGLYVAYATGTDSSATWAYVEDGVHSFPVACPATLFDVLDPRPSSVWIANTHLQYTVQAAPEWALDPYDYYDRLTDGEPRAREQYEERKRFMDLEFARPDVTSVATPVGDDEAMCDHCSHVWTPPSVGQLIRCPRCQYLQNRPRRTAESSVMQVPMNLRPDETELTGGWVREGAKVRGDAACERIDHLVASVLQKLGASQDSGGWDTLYRDPADGRLWEHTYPQSYMHGGGPPKLATISRDEAIRRYGREMVEDADR